MKLKKIKQRQLTLFKRHAFKRFLAKIDAGGYKPYTLEQLFNEHTKGKTT